MMHSKSPTTKTPGRRLDIYGPNGAGMATPIELLEIAWCFHYRHIASHDNYEISSSRGDVYPASLRLVYALIREAFPHGEPDAVYEMLVDAGAEFDPEHVRRFLNGE